jgi:hypothetical protein
MDYAKLLAHGVGSWLQYEHACGHSELFSEKYLAQPIGNILSGQTGNRARAEFTHPVLSGETSAIANSFISKPLTIESLIVDRSSVLALSRADLVRRAGYKKQDALHG